MVGQRLARSEKQEMGRRVIASTSGEVPSSRRPWLSDLPGWCVDQGTGLKAMTTCELWLALAKGDVTPQMKVWREGMAYWEVVATVPEFALALPDADLWEPASVRAPAAVVTAAFVAETVEKQQRETLPGQSSWPAASPVVEGLTVAPSGDFATPSPMVVEHGTASPPASGVRPRGLDKLDRRSALSVAIGAAVAVFALAVATSGPAPGRGPNQDRSELAHAAAMGAPELPRAAATPAAAVSGLAAPAPAPLATATTALTAPDAIPTITAEKPAMVRRGPRSKDRGQRRARVGGSDERSAAADATLHAVKRD